MRSTGDETMTTAVPPAQPAIKTSVCQNFPTGAPSQHIRCSGSFLYFSKARRVFP